MKVIFGLGNPGEQYANTRHNAGQLLVDQMFSVQYSMFNDTYGWRRKKNIMVAEFPEVILVKSAGYFMNESGSVARDFFSTSPLAPLLNSGEGNKKEGFFLAHDDLDIKLGEYKIQFGTGPKVHNGVESVENALGTKEFWRIRIGINNREPSFAKATEGKDYVLQRFSREEKEILEKVLEKITKEVITPP